MVRVYVMQTCPDCAKAKEQAMDDPRLNLIDIGEHARNLKQFLQLRDSNPAFDRVRQLGNIGIPCFVFEDGHITFSLDKANLILKDMPFPIKTEVDNKEMDTPDGASCSIDGTGC